MKLFKYTAIGLIAVYFFALLVVYFTQRNYIYFPYKTAAPVGFNAQYGVETVTINVENVGALRSYYARPQKSQPVVLFFHGNGGSVYSRTKQISDFKSWGFGLLAVEYPGYGDNLGIPNQVDIFATALENYDFLIMKGHKPENIVIYGNSLGAAIAIYVASQREGALLVLSAPFYSALDMAKKQMPFFPVSLLLKDKYRSDLNMGRVDEPMLIIHGTADQVVPYGMGRRLFSMHKGRAKTFETIEGGRHYMWGDEMSAYMRNEINRYAR